MSTAVLSSSSAEEDNMDPTENGEVSADPDDIEMAPVQVVVAMDDTIEGSASYNEDSVLNPDDTTNGSDVRHTSDDEEEPEPDDVRDEAEEDAAPPAETETANSAAVVFDATSRSFSVVDDPDLLVGMQIGDNIEHRGQAYTVMQLFTSAEEACEDCEKRRRDVSTTAGLVNTLFYNSSQYEEPIEDLSCTEINEVKTEWFNAGEPSPEPAEYETSDSALESLRYVFAVYYNELSEDIGRLNQRQQNLAQMMSDILGGTWDTGRVDTRLAFDPKNPPLLRRLSVSKRIFRPYAPPACLDEDDELSQYFPGTSADYGRKRPAPPPAPAAPDKDRFKRPRFNEDKGKEPEEFFSKFGGKDVAHPGYKYISKAEEEECFESAKGSAANYTQRLARIIFADSLHLYFKDQDPKKRTWIHEMVDYRFPSEDRQSHMYKWKNCSWAINKNRLNKEITEVSAKRQNGVSQKKTVSRSITPLKPDFPYVTEALEQEVYELSPQDPVKYTELLAFRLFKDSLDKMFSEQDGAKKEWLRDCVDWRFPMAEKAKRDSRWKVCGAAANRNRLKQVENGEAVAYPFVSKEFEESCLRSARGNPAVYAELLGRGLFSASLDVSFKDQDPRRRTWLHDILDRRFPTPDKLKQIAKWKLCSSAINKNRQLQGSATASGSPAPSTISKHSSSVRGTPAPVKTETDGDTPLTSKKGSVPTRSAAKSVSSSSSTKQDITKSDKSKSKTSEKSAPSSAPTTRLRDGTNSLRSRSLKREVQQVPSTRTSTRHRAAASPESSSSISDGVLKEESEFDPGSLDVEWDYGMTDAIERDCFVKSAYIASTYARLVGKVIFKDSINEYYRDQDPSKRDLLKILVDTRYPTPRKRDHEMKWKNCMAAINKNRTI